MGVLWRLISSVCLFFLVLFDVLVDCKDVNSLSLLVFCIVRLDRCLESEEQALFRSECLPLQLGVLVEGHCTCVQHDVRDY